MILTFFNKCSILQLEIYGKVSPPKQRRDYMSLTRKFLTALGIEADKIDEIINAHSETVDALKEQRDTFKEKASKYDETLKNYEDIKTKYDELNKTTKNDELFKTKYDDLEKEFAKYKNDIANKETKANKEKAYSELLNGMNIPEKFHKSILKITDVDKLELEDGKLKDIDELKKSIKEEYSDFIVTASTKGADTPSKPLNNGRGTTKTIEEIDNIKDGSERRKAMLENPELFGLSN